MALLLLIRKSSQDFITASRINSILMFLQLVMSQKEDLIWLIAKNNDINIICKQRDKARQLLNVCQQTLVTE